MCLKKESVGGWELGKTFFFLTRLQFPLSEELSTAHVVDLIDLLTKQWYLTQLDNLFLPQEVSSVLSIDLCRNQILDTLIWPFNQSSQYSL